MLQATQRPLLIRGKVVHPDGSARDRYVLVRDGVVETVSRRRPPLGRDAVEIRTGSEDWIFPGLLDLNTHSTYNLQPIWDSPLAPFDNRFQWRSDPGYRQEVSGVNEQFKVWEEARNRRPLAVFAELQAVAGGTAVVQESTDLERDLRLSRGLLLCRDASSPEQLSFEAGGRILSVVDFFRPDPETGRPVPDQKSIDHYLKSRDEGRLYATLAHLAEGRSGFGHNRGPDTYSRREFEAFMAHPAFADAGAVRSSPLALIHGSGIDAADRAHREFLRQRRISVIWSPVANLLLYGDTLDVETLLDAGINVALGSDRSPSGSKHVWDEARFARFYFDAIGSAVSDEQIFQMVTTNAGRCLGVPHLGRIEPGGLGDFFILRSPLESDNPLEVFFSTTDRHVRAVVVGGRPIYGARELLEQFDVELQPLPEVEGSAVADQAVHLPPELGVDLVRDLGRLEAFLKELKEPVRRSHLLASSDKIYRRRIQELKATVADFGWSVREWRRKGPSPTPGEVLVNANCVRVGRGFRAPEVEPEDFRSQLGAVLIPATVQIQAPLGLTAYLPTVLPAKKPDGVPDSVELVFFESKQTCSQSFATVAGRACGFLHRPLFAPASKSGFPDRLVARLGAGKPYYVVPGKADWFHGRCRVLVGSRPAGEAPATFRAGILGVLRELQKRRPGGLDGAIVVADDDYLVYWEHWADPAGGEGGAIAELEARVLVVLRDEARPFKVPADFHAEYEGLEIRGGECLNAQFLRRRLYPR